MDNILYALIIAGVTGAVSTTGTVIALRVHILYLRENIKRLDYTTNRAHSRIDEIERSV